MPCHVSAHKSCLEQTQTSNLHIHINSMYWQTICFAVLLTGCACKNQTLLVTRGNTAISVNDSSIDEPIDLPYGFSPPEDLLRIGVQIYTVDSNETMEELCEALKDYDPSVLTCEGDVSFSIDQANATDDPYIQQQSNLDTMNIEAAWAKGYVGNPAVRVCVIDSGRTQQFLM